MKDNQKPGLKRYFVGALLLFGLLSAPAAQAETRLVVRDSLGLQGINLTCALLGCQVLQDLGDPQGQLFVVTFPSVLDPVTALLRLQLGLGIVDIEIDQIVNTQSADAGPPPSYLTDKTPTYYYGTTVWHGYVSQPANELIRTNAAHSAFSVAGAGVTVAVIDTGVDPTHSVLRGVLLPAQPERRFGTNRCQRERREFKLSPSSRSQPENGCGP